MSITDELREWARDNTVQGEVLTTYPVQHPVHGTLESLVAIADRIDAEHESKVSYWQGASYKDGYDEGFASADDWLAQHEDAMAEHGWVKLPLGADGVPIHIGDSIEIIGGEYGTAVAIELCEDGGWNVSMRPTGWDTPTLFAAECVRHHHPPAVEDILREFALRAIRESEGNYGDLDETCAEYAAKLKLAGDAE